MPSLILLAPDLCAATTADSQNGFVTCARSRSGGADARVMRPGSQDDGFENRFDLGEEHEARGRLDDRPMALLGRHDFHDVADGVADRSVLARRGGERVACTRRQYDELCARCQIDPWHEWLHSFDARGVAAAD
ncbi:MAG TPA: hypothetical protein VHN20_07940, partial [Beijerinckiaceae bacterium]|nr:hypothetical protein [Beijerinckiaceae bacterium]